MKFLIVLSVLFYPVQLVLVSYDPKEGTRTREETPPEKMMLSLPSEKCENLSVDGRSDGEACTEHCKALKKEFSGGECSQGICRCQIDIDDLIRSIVGNAPGTKTMRKPKKTEKAGKGVKCRNLIRLGGKVGSENHKGCEVHCRLLNSQNKNGHCVDGVCQCSTEPIESRPRQPPQISYEDDEEEKQDVEVDEKEKEVEEEIDDYCDNDKKCMSYCRGINKNGGRCLENTCVCSNPPRRVPNPKIPDSINGIPSILRMKCEHKRKSKNEEICKAHCNSFSKDHTEGQCIDGVCHCGYAVFEMEEMEYEDEINRNVEVTRRTKKPRRERDQN